MESKPLVSIVIPHYQGREILRNCLQGVTKTDYPNYEVILVDNASRDNSTADIERDFPAVRVVRNTSNLGYAGGCNSGITVARGEYLLFLNNDTKMEPGWLAPLVDACEKDSQTAACQPKILSLSDPDKFDYAGAAGGLLDIFGYPFALGRLFQTVESDTGQYDNTREIFWASGTALLVRKSVLEEIGAFDEDFFAHMEEIDLCWRMHLAGYRVISVPDSVVYHESGSTLRPDSFRKMFLNHRNSILMLIKNYELPTLFRVLPCRLLLELVTAAYALARLDLTRFRAVLSASLAVVARFGRTLKKRRVIAGYRRVQDRELMKKMYRGSIVVRYFLNKARSVSELKL